MIWRMRTNSLQNEWGPTAYKMNEDQQPTKWMRTNSLQNELGPTAYKMNEDQQPTKWMRTNCLQNEWGPTAYKMNEDQQPTKGNAIALRHSVSTLTVIICTALTQTHTSGCQIESILLVVFVCFVFLFCFFVIERHACLEMNGSLRHIGSIV